LERKECRCHRKKELRGGNENGVDVCNVTYTRGILAAKVEGRDN